LEEELDKDTVCLQFFSTFTANTLPRKLWMVWKLQDRRAKYQTLKYANEFVLMAKEETVLEGMIDKLIEIGRNYGMEMNVDKTNMMIIS
jgi:hypothetical protein